MNSMKIGTYQMDTTFGLYLPEYTIPAPAVQTNFVKIIGRDGSVDLSNALGLHYDSRTWSLDFKCFDPTVNWHTLSSQVMNAIHGKRLNFEFDDDPNYFWTGRVSVQNYVSNHGTGTLKATIVSDPFKYAKLSTIVTKTASTGTDYTGALVTFNTANAKINDLSVTMQPIQDLHGYDAPWPAGGGKNLLENTGVSKTENGITWTVNSDGSISASGTASGNALFVVNQFTFDGQSYILTGCPEGGAVSTKWQIQVLESLDSGAIAVDDGPGVTISRTGNLYIRCVVRSGNTVNFVFKPMIRLATETDATFAPYSNICPISGRTGLSVYVGPTQDQQDATTYAVDWTDEAGTVYGGTLDVVTGVLTVDRAMVDLGTLTWGFSTTAGNVKCYYSNDISTLIKPVASHNDTPDMISSKYQTFAWNSRRSVTNGISMLSNGQLRIIDSNYQSESALSDFTASLSGVQLCYKLATPLTYQLTAQEVEALVGTNNVWSDGGNVTVAVVTPETLTNNGRAVVPTLTASADMVLKWGNYSASVQQGTSTIPQLILENGANLIYIIGTGSISFTWQEASL